MDTQKKTRSAGPVNFIVSAFAEDTLEEDKPPERRPRAERRQDVKERKEDAGETTKKQSAESRQPREKPQKQKEREKEREREKEKEKGEESLNKLKRHPDHYRKEERSEEKKEAKREEKKETRSGIAAMTKEKEEEIGRMMQRLSKISELKKTQADRADKEVPIKPIFQERKAPESEVLVDQHYPKGSEVRVYVDAKGFCFSVTFNHADVAKNINKFYVMQILQSLPQPDQFIVFTRWGRVGLTGNKAETGPFSLEEALDNYRAKVQEKLEHGYKKIETEYENNRRNFYFPQRERKGAQVESKLEPKVQALIRLIFDMKMVASQLKEIGLDSKKMPLGKIAGATILRGYEALKEVMQAVRAHRPKETLMELSSKFFSHIPHDFGMKVLATYVLDTEAKVRGKLQLLQSLQDIQVFTRLLEEPQENPDLNELDANYLRLSYLVAPLPRDTPTFATIMRYVDNTHAPSHNQYKLEVDAVYQLTSRLEEPPLEVGNRQLLWHGSRLTNFVGILSSGLRIAPPEAPATGYMFGKGVYFADVVSKSANYCHATKLNPFACLLLCEVALGTPSEKFYADYYANLLPAECQSVKGVGRSAPKEGEQLGEVLVPNGPLVETGISNTSLHYNEYVVYDVGQIRCRYLLKVKFVFK